MPRYLINEKFLLAASVLVVLVFGGMDVVIAHEGEDHSAKAEQPALSAQGKRVVEALQGYAAAYQSGDIAKIENYVVKGDGFSSLEGTFQDSGWKSYRKHLADELPLFKETSYKLSNIRPYVPGRHGFCHNWITR